ncbi:hypothetical protein GGI43DRAFT_413924 [Trichoderma evansii]
MDALSRQTNAISGDTADSVDQDRINRVLRAKRVYRGPACIPCRHRKVKCDHSQPCRTCLKRGHPDICVYTLSEPDDQQRASATRHSPSANRPSWNGSFGIQLAQTNPIIARDDGTNEAEPLASPRIGASPGNSAAIHRSTEEVLSTVTPTASNRDPNEQPYSGGTSILTQLHLLDPDSFRDIAEDAAPILGLQKTHSRSIPS